jgi:hypothetical protein
MSICIDAHMLEGVTVLDQKENQLFGCGEFLFVLTREENKTPVHFQTRASRGAASGIGSL